MPKGKILVVDDSPLVRKLAEVSLVENDYEVYTAEDGEEGLRIARDVKPDLILVDFIMPKMTGSQFCKFLRENEDLKDIPVILITGKGETVGQTFIEKYGVLDYFIKPFKSEDLLSKVNSIIGKTEKKETEIPETFMEESILETSKTEEIISQPEELLLQPEKEVVSTEEKIEELPFSDISFEMSLDHIEGEQKDEEEQIEIVEPEESISLEELQEISNIPSFSIEEEFEIEKLEIPESLESEDKKIEEYQIQMPEPELGREMETKNMTSDEILERFSIQPEIPEIKELITKATTEEAKSEQSKIISEPSISIPNIEKIINDKLESFILMISSTIENSIESILKKYDLIKESGKIISGLIEFFGVNEIFRLITSKNLTGLISIFTKGISYEFLLVEGKIVYSISSLQKQKIGNRLFINLSDEEIENLIRENIKFLTKGIKGTFIFELKNMEDLNDLVSKKRYDLQNFFNNV
ncbi:response regulator [Thermodesulfovibrio hydrogeniphilus]